MLTSTCDNGVDCDEVEAREIEKIILIVKRAQQKP